MTSCKSYSLTLFPRVNARFRLGVVVEVLGSMFFHPIASGDAFENPSPQSRPHVSDPPPSREHEQSPSFWLVFIEAVAVGFIGTLLLMCAVLVVSFIVR